MSRLLALALCSLLLPAPSAHAESADSKRIVAVLYFDNNTGDASFDVLQKGFADMMVTDLSAVDKLQLVEREKLQQIIDEQKLQRSKYFEPKTAVKLGQLVGAQYAVTGSFQAVDPQMRIDIKLLEIKTGKVIVADKVTGLKNKLFDLQQQLVARFVEGLELQLSEKPRLKSRATDVDTMLSYSKAIDLVDQGKLQEASQQLAAVVSKAPTFLLARERHEQILARLKAAEAKRAETFIDVAETLRQNAEQFLKTHKHAELKEAESAMFLGYRLVMMQYLLRALRPHLAPKHPHLIMPGHEAHALALLQLWRTHALAFIRESADHFQRFQAVLPDGTAYLSNTSLTLPPEDEERVKLAHFEPLRFEDDAALEVAQFILMGRFKDRDDSVQMGPTPADLDPSAMKEGLRLLEQALQAAEAHRNARQRELSVRRALELHGDALHLRGQVEEAVAKWQLFLDRFPTSDSFKLMSNKIKTALGVGSNHHQNMVEQYNQALSTCEKSPLIQGYSGELHRRLVTRGYKAAREMFLELDARCGDSQELRPYLAGLLISSALSAGNARDCESFHALTPRYLELRGSRSDIDGYLKNYVPHCRPAGDAGP